MADFKGIYEKFLWCRDVRHSWDQYDVRDNLTEVLQVLLCVRCGTKRTRVLAEDGSFLRSGGYEYPEGYLLKQQGGMTPADRAMLRTINMKSQTQRPKRRRTK